MPHAPTHPSPQPGVAVFQHAPRRYDAWFDSPPGRHLFHAEVRALRLLTPGLPRPWLEVGAGTGRFAHALDMDVGADPAAAALRLARGRRLPVAQALGQALPFPDSRFGAVFLIATLCFADDPAALLREARRVTAPAGGVILAVVPADTPWGKRYAAHGRAGHFFYAHARFFHLHEIHRLALAAGLRFHRAVSTLFRPPDAPGRRLETPKRGLHPAAGFVALRYRPAGPTRPENRRT